MHTYKVYDTHEFGFDYNGFHYLVIYGSHINGGFIAIPNWNISIEASRLSSWGETIYNAEKLMIADTKEEFPEKVALEIAKAVKADYDNYLQKISKKEGVWMHFGVGGYYVEDGEIKASYDESGLSGLYYYFDNEFLKIKSLPSQVAKTMEETYVTRQNGLGLG